MTLSLAIHASEDFNTRLSETLAQLSSDVVAATKDNFIALILGGGYGRGEGGVIIVEGVEMPYNDLDLVLVVKSKDKVSREALQQIEEKYERELKIHVDFARPLTAEDIEQWPHWMVWHDLLNGHHVLAGPKDILIKNASPLVSKALPAIEGTRLLLNRGAGLLGSMTVLHGLDKSQDSDFSRRNYYKCGLALGDSLMVAYGFYQTPYSGRDERFLRFLEEHDELATLELKNIYRKALLFKFSPDKLSETPPDEEELHAMAEAWGKVFLAVERKRTGMKWASIEEYINWKGIREPEQNTWNKLPRNLVRNAQVGRISWRYSREWLYRRLPILLGVSGLEEPDWPNASMRFLRIWERLI